MKMKGASRTSLRSATIHDHATRRLVSGPAFSGESSEARGGRFAEIATLEGGCFGCELRDLPSRLSRCYLK